MTVACFPAQPILVVEDHELTAPLMVELLRGAFPGREVHLAGTAGQAFSEFVRLRPAVMVVDVGLPDGSGLDLTRRIVAADPGATVLVHSGNDNAVMRAAAAVAGARGFASKSDPRELVRVVGQLLDIVARIENSPRPLAPRLTDSAGGAS